MSVRTLFGPGTFVLGGASVLLVGLLAIGFLLPSEWEASAERVLDVPADSLLTYLDSPEGWRLWTTWPDSATRSGPVRGAGAAMAWANREIGSGTFRIVEASSEAVSYVVEVEGVGGALTTGGTLTLEGAPGRTRLTWHERGDLGPNPLMGWWGLTMERAQSRELAMSLDQLAAVLDGIPYEPLPLEGARPATTDSAPSR